MAAALNSTIRSSNNANKLLWGALPVALVVAAGIAVFATPRALILCSLGDLEHLAGSNDLALNSYADANAADPNLLKPLLAKATLLEQLGREDSLPVWKELLEHKSTRAVAAGHLAFLEMKKGNYEAALDYSDKWVEEQPKSERAYLERGIALSRLRRFDEAMKSIDQSLALRPTAQAREEKNSLVNKMQMLDIPAKILMEPSFENKPNDYWALLRDAQRQLSFEMITKCSKAIAMRPEDPHGYYLRGIAYAKCKRPAEAVMDLNTSLKLSKSQTMHFSLPQEIGSDLNLNSLLKKPDIGPDDVLYRIGEEYEHMGDLKQSLEYLNKAVAIAPHAQRNLYERRGRVYDLMGDHARAQADYAKANELARTQPAENEKSREFYLKMMY